MYIEKQEKIPIFVGEKLAQKKYYLGVDVVCANVLRCGYEFYDACFIENRFGYFGAGGC